jgi:cyclin H
MKRFYLKNTVMDWHPKNVMQVSHPYLFNGLLISCRLTALFLATKTTNNPISLEAYTSHIPKTIPSDVLDLEFLVAQSLGFEFVVWHAHRALWGIWLDIQGLPSAPADYTQDIYDAAMTHVRASRLTDAELIYSPSQIALACMSFSSPSFASQWLATKYPSSTDTLQVTIEKIKSLITQCGHPPDVESVRTVDRRLKLCKNPEKVVGSKAYLAKKAEEERKAEGKRNKKADEVRKAMENEDPFGEELSGKEKEEKIKEIVDEEDED